MEAKFLERQTAEDLWKRIVHCWNKTYLGPPDYLHVDHGSNYISKEFGSTADAEGIAILKAPIESPGSISHVERYQAPL